MRILVIINLLMLFVCLQLGCEEATSPVEEEHGMGCLVELQFFWDFLAQIEATEFDQRQALVDSFMAAIDTLSKPFTENIFVVYLYQNDQTAPVQVPGDHNNWNPEAHVMTWIDSTDLYYLHEVFPADSRLDYKFKIGSNWVLDPLNPRTVTGGFGPNSELVMPDFVDPLEILEYPEIPHGTLLTTTFTSDILNNSRTVRVYLPPSYNSGENFPSIYVHDGGEYVSLASMVNVLDYCINHNICEPVIAVFVDPVDRNAEYWLNDDFRRFFVEEMVPYIDGQYNTLNDPARRAMMGCSLGGLTSFFISYEHPEVFGLCAGHSSAFQVENGWMINEMQSGEVKSIEFYFDVGTFESLLDDNQQMRDVLESKGYEFLYNEWNDGHSWGNWRGHIDNILQRFFPESNP